MPGAGGRLDYRTTESVCSRDDKLYENFFNWWPWAMRILVAVRALFVRALFIIYALFAVWHLVLIEENPYYWLLLLSIIPLIVEFIVEVVVLMRRRPRKVVKWFSPAIFLFLLCACPPIWLGEIYLYNKAHQTNMTTLAKTLNREIHNSPQYQNLTSSDVFLKIQVMVTQWSPQNIIRVLEQTLLLALICGRWLLPRGGITRDQLSQLLLVNIGMAADILELFEAFNEDVVRNDVTLTLIILSLWQASLLQFCLTKTATKARKSRGGYNASNNLLSADPNAEPVELSTCLCCETEMWAICSSLVLQDVPFLVMRMTLIVNFKVVSYSNIFFTCKNTLVIMLQIFRMFVIFLENRYPPQPTTSRKESKADLCVTKSMTSLDGRSPPGRFNGPPSYRSHAHNSSSGRRPLPYSKSEAVSFTGRKNRDMLNACSSPQLQSMDDDSQIHSPSNGSQFFPEPGIRSSNNTPLVVTSQRNNQPFAHQHRRRSAGRGQDSPNPTASTAADARILKSPTQFTCMSEDTV